MSKLDLRKIKTSDAPALKGKYFNAKEGNISLIEYELSDLQETELERIINTESQAIINIKPQDLTRTKTYKYLEDLSIEDAIDSAIELTLKRLRILTCNYSEEQQTHICQTLFKYIQHPTSKLPSPAREFENQVKLPKNRVTNLMHIANAGAAIKYAITLFRTEDPSYSLGLLYGGIIELHYGEQKLFKSEKLSKSEIASQGGEARYKAYYQPIKDRLYSLLREKKPEQGWPSSSAALSDVYLYLELSEAEEKRVKHAGSKRLLIKWTNEFLMTNT